MRKMPIGLQMLAAAVVSILTIGLAYLDIPFIGPVISLIGVLVLPGWLFTNVLFGSRNEPDQETRFILVFGLGSVLIALELVILSLAGARISRESVALTGAVTSLLLVGILILRSQTGRSDSGNVPVPIAFVLSVIVVLGLYGFVPLHQPVVEESYTEFYIVPRAYRTADGQISEADLVIFNHEQKEYAYTVLCSDTTGLEELLVQSSLEPESSFIVKLSVPPAQPGFTSKIRLSLYRAEDAAPYRWVELVGGGCNLLP